MKELIREIILKKLKDKKISQRRCAQDNGLDVSNFNSFLHGKRPLPIDDIEKILAYLDIRLS